MKPTSAHPTSLLADFAERALPAAARVEVAIHIQACEPCRLETERWEGLFAAFHRLPAPAVPGGLSDRILFAVARERARQSRVRSWVGRAAAALSWGYVTGGMVFSATALAVALIPAWRAAAGSAMGYASGVALRFGLGVLDAVANTLAWVRDGAGDLVNRAGWISSLVRAVSSALSQPEAQLLLAGCVSATLLIYLVFLAGGSSRRGDRLEAPHAGFLVA